MARLVVCYQDRQAKLILFDRAWYLPLAVAGGRIEHHSDRICLARGDGSLYIPLFITVQPQATEEINMGKNQHKAMNSPPSCCLMS